MRTFNRVAELQLGTLIVSDLRFTFTVERTLRPTPGKATIQVYNLTQSHREEIDGLDTVPVVLTAGYEDGTHVVFNGDLRDVKNAYTSPDWITEISGSDGQARRTARTRRSFRPGTTLDAVVQALASDLGVGIGNVISAIDGARLAGASTEFVAGTTLDGNAWAQLVALCASAELELSVQNGQLQAIPLRQALDGTSLVVSSDTGMIGSPTKAKGGRVVFKTQMIPDLFPGRAVELQSRNVEGGQYRVTKALYRGDTHGPDWFIECEAEPVTSRRARR